MSNSSRKATCKGGPASNRAPAAHVARRLAQEVPYVPRRGNTAPIAADVQVFIDGAPAARLSASGDFQTSTDPVKRRFIAAALRRVLVELGARA